jgi:hypothetical protein
MIHEAFKALADLVTTAAAMLVLVVIMVLL